MKSIANRLRDALGEMPDRMSGAELGRRAGVLAVTVGAYLRGDRNPPMDVCFALARVLGVQGQWLFDGKGPKRAKEAAPEVGSRVVDIPLIDEVTAGKLTAPGSQIPEGERDTVSVADLGNGDFFATRVRGSSMDRVSPEGSIIIVNRREMDLVPSRFYLFNHRGETTYKRWPGGDPAYLEPVSTDPVHKPLFIKSLRGLAVIGRVKRTILDL